MAHKALCDSLEKCNFYSGNSFMSYMPQHCDLVNSNEMVVILYIQGLNLFAYVFHSFTYFLANICFNPFVFMPMTAILNPVFHSVE
jgi:hypothetical protein